MPDHIEGSPERAAERQEREQKAAELWLEWPSPDLGVRSELAALYWPLVLHIARKVRRELSGRVELDELAGWGAEGLLDALERFDASRGVRFEAFAKLRIRGAIFDGLRSFDWAPKRVRRLERELAQRTAELGNELRRRPSDAEQAAALDMSVDDLRIEKVRLRQARVESLDGLTSAQGEFDLGPSSSDDPADAAIAKDALDVLRRGISLLPERERRVAEMNFLGGMKLADIGRCLGVGESRVSQLRQEARASLRNFLSEQGLVPAD